MDSVIRRVQVLHHEKNPSHFAVVVIPFVVNELTRSTNPIKAYEYLAGGNPLWRPTSQRLRICLSCISQKTGRSLSETSIEPSR